MYSTCTKQKNLPWINENRLFTTYPNFLPLFPSLHAQFPLGKIDEKEKFRDNKEIRNHGSAVIKLLDEMISEFENPIQLKGRLDFAISKHLSLTDRRLTGEEFSVSFTHLNIHYLFKIGSRNIGIRN